MERVARAAHPRAARGPGARRGALRNLHPRRRRAALGALAALLLGAALAAPAWAEDIWSATLTPVDLSHGFLGCNSNLLGANLKCSNTAVLTDNAFTHDSTSYTVVSLSVQSDGTFQFTVDPPLTTATAPLTLVVGSTSLDIADGTVDAPPGSIFWDTSGVSLTIGTAVSVSLVSGTGIVHPRVLMDTQITVGGYRQDDST